MATEELNQKSSQPTTNMATDKKGYGIEVYQAMTNEQKNQILQTASTIMGSFISHPSTLSSITSASTRVLAAWGFRKWFLRIAADMLSDIGYIDFTSSRFKNAKNPQTGELLTVDVNETNEPNETDEINP